MADHSVLSALVSPDADVLTDCSMLPISIAACSSVDDVHVSSSYGATLDVSSSN